MLRKGDRRKSFDPSLQHFTPFTHSSVHSLTLHLLKLQAAEFALSVLAGEAELGAGWWTVACGDLHLLRVCFAALLLVGFGLVAAELAATAVSADTTCDERENESDQDEHREHGR